MARASSKPIPSCTILVSMKLVVPFTMPSISSTRLAARHSCRGAMTGVPPPTLASNRKAALWALARASSSAPWVATSSLLLVQTLRPLSRQALTKG